jgi:microcompartment protein CcmL/EutN
LSKALGLAECIGFTTAMAFVDSATKTANVEILGIEKVIGVAKSISVVVKISGEVAAVQAAVDAGITAAEKIGKVVSQRVIANPGKGLEKLIHSTETKNSLIINGMKSRKKQ